MGHPLGVAVLEVLGADRVLTQAEVDSTNIFSFDPAAARNLDLPAEADNAASSYSSPTPPTVRK